MASSKVQKQCESWIVQTWLPNRFCDQFENRRLEMQGRGHFEFDAVNKHQTIVGNISTATATTHTGAIASGKKSKIRADCLMLSLVNAEKKLLILTEECMYSLAQNEQIEGRLPLDVEIYHVDLPSNLKDDLAKARNESSK